VAEDNVDKPSAIIETLSKNWPMIDALVGGTSAMRAAGQTFLPKWPAESEDSYNCRRHTATLFDAYNHTCKINAAKPFSRPIKFNKEPPASITSLFTNIDRQGTDLHAFAGHLMLHCLQYGLVGVLVDHPPVFSARTIAQERAIGARPYFTTYTGSSILGWRTTQTEDGVILSQLRLMECVSEPDGEWGERQVIQVRVLEPGTWQTYRKNEDPRRGNLGEWLLESEGTTSLSKIPFVFFYGIRDERLGVGYPPLLELAHANVKHWQSSSDQDTITHTARVPILFASGFSDSDKLVIGANSVVQAIKSDADLKFVEHSGAAIEAGRRSLVDLEDQMRQMGAELLIQRPSITTATQVRSENEGPRSILQRIVEDFEESLETAIKLLGEWKKETFEVEVELFKDFGADDLSQKSGDLLLGAVDRRVVSKETAFHQLQRMDVVSHDIGWEDEESRLAKEQVEEPDEDSQETDKGEDKKSSGEQSE